MDMSKETSMLKSKDVMVEDCWIPVTPAKPGLEKNQETRIHDPHLVEFENFLLEKEAKKGKQLESGANSTESFEECEEQMAFWGLTNSDFESMVFSIEKESLINRAAIQGLPKSLTEQVAIRGSTKSDCGNRVISQENISSAKQVAFPGSTKSGSRNSVFNQKKRSLTKQVPAFTGSVNSDLGNSVFYQEDKFPSEHIAFLGLPCLSPKKENLAEKPAFQSSANSDYRSRVFNQEKKSLAAGQVAFSGFTNPGGNRMIHHINKTSTREVAFRGSPGLPFSHFEACREKESLAKQVAFHGSPNSKFGIKLVNNEKESSTEQVAFWGLPNNDDVSRDEFDESLLNSMPFTDLLNLVDNGSTNVKNSSSLVHSSPTDTGISLGSSCFQNQNGKGASLPCISTFDLNTPAKNITEFAPVTPSIDSSIYEFQNENDQIQLGEEKAQEKPKRKRHRPKVIREGQPKRVRKTSTPKQAGPGGTPSTSGKRKYVRKQVPAAATPPAQESQNAESSCKRALNFEFESPNVSTQKSCKRSLNFEFESQTKEETTIPKEPLDCNLDQTSTQVRAEKTNQDPSPVTPDKTEQFPRYNTTNYAQNSAKGKFRTIFPNATLNKEASSAPNFINQTQISHTQILQAYHMIPYEYNNNNCTTSARPMHGELVPYMYSYNMARPAEVVNNQVVIYKREGAVVPLEGPLKRKKERPKVELDEETNRVWNLLIQDINSEGVNGTADKAKWWEDERRVFRGRADSFIARMHLIQGDRRFSKWKGSVVDSVVGVFLTQNVSDHLSSSAFMSLASKFPLKSNTEEEPLKEDSTTILLQEPEVSVQESTDSTGCDRSSVTVQCVESSSQNFAESSITQSSERAELSKHNNFERISSFVQLLELAELTTSNHSSRNSSNVSEEKCLSEESQLTAESTVHNTVKMTSENTNEIKSKKGKEKEKEKLVDWDIFRKKAEENGKRERTAGTMDSMDYEELMNTDVNVIADAIKERGMNNRLAERIKEFLSRIVSDHGSIDLEWLRDVPPDRAKEYLLSIKGLGLKSVECVRLLTLHHLAFPVDTNVGRIAVRLGWVPLQPLPESLQLHLLELYPVLESIQKYLWPRLCKIDQKTLYELHYQMITFGKVFCTKSRPNCNACPLRGECRHFASAFASARLALPAPEEEKNALTTMRTATANQNPTEIKAQLQLPPPQTNHLFDLNSKMVNFAQKIQKTASQEPIIEEPASPEPEIQTQTLEKDIEDAFYEDPDEIPTITLNLEEFTQNLQSYMEKNMELKEGEMSKALVALTPDAASIPVPKLKSVSQLRTEHQVYELPDSHPLIAEFDAREPDDPCPYLLAIWTPGETAESYQAPEGSCNSNESGKLCDEKTCFSCNNKREAYSSTVRGTILIPCRTANRGSFPLNGTYFQVNEVFADHESSLKPIDIPRSWIWDLPRRIVYFGTSIPTIFKGLTTEGVQQCFWRGFVCVRGFDRKTRAPRPLMARLHFPASKLAMLRAKAKARTDENHSQNEPRHPPEIILTFSHTSEDQRRSKIQAEKRKGDLVIGIIGSIPEPEPEG